MKGLLPLFLLLIFTTRGLSQICSPSVARGRALDNILIQVEVSMPDPVCIRCGYVDDVTLVVVLVTNTDNVTYTTGGNVIANTTDISVTNDGLILNDPGNTIADGNTVQCTFNQPGTGQVTRTITVDHLFNNPPSVNPDGGDDRIEYVTEGSSITLTCTRDNNNAGGDLYQWIHPNGQMTPGAPSDSPVQVTLNNINRNEDGVYICQGSRDGMLDSALKNNVTLNVQYPAKILSFTPGNTTLTVTSKLVLNCTFEGNPTPHTVLWSHNRSEVFPASDPNLSQTNTNSYSLLEVNFANINISGEYACGVNNSLDFDQTDFTFITVQVAPGPVVNLVNDSSTNTTVTLSWTFGFDGNAEIVGVDISYTAIANYGPSDDGAANGSVSTTDGGQTSITINGLQPLTTYQFTVRVRNTVSDEVGVSSPVSVTADTLPLVPDPPILNSVTAVSSTVLRVEWTANLNTNTQTPIIGFVVYYNVLGDDNVQNKTVENSTATSTSITGLMKGTDYQVKMVSSNEVGPSNNSDTIEKRTNIDPPSAVTNLTATAFPFSICLLWRSPVDNGGQDIQEYRIQKWNRDRYQMENFTFVADVDAAVLTFTVENLDNNTDYSIRVTANNTINGEGGLGDPRSVNASTGEEIPRDPGFVVSVSEDYITAISANVSWTVPEDTNHSIRLQISEEGEDFNPDVYTNYSAGTRYAIVPNLQPNTSYDIRLTRIEAEGCIRRVSNIIGFDTRLLEVEVNGPTTGTVEEGTVVTLLCNLDTGGVAPNVTWKFNGMDLPMSAQVNGYNLTITNPQLSDAGNYTCFSRAGTPDETSFTFSLLVVPSPIPSSPSVSPTLTGSPSSNPSTALPIGAIAGIAVGAFLCVLFFVVMVIVLVYCCCCRKESEKSTARYDLAKTKTPGMWMDQGAGEFAPIQFSSTDPDAPVERGRTMTNDYATATSFNTKSKETAEGIKPLMEEDGAYQTDV